MKWLTLSSEKFEPIPNIEFSIKKPLFAASVVLKFTKSQDHVSGQGEVLGHASLEARVPIKGLMHYTVEALSSRLGRTFGFSFIRESDVTGGSARETFVKGLEGAGAGGRESLEIDKAKVDVVNESPAPILAHVLMLPAFAQTHDSGAEASVYGAHLMMGRRVQALRIERIGAAAAIETYEGKLMSVACAVDEKEFAALPWSSRKAFEFDWDVRVKRITAARFTVPIFGKLEIKA